MWNWIKKLFYKKKKPMETTPVIIQLEPIEIIPYRFPDISHYKHCDFRLFDGKDIFTKATQGAAMVDNTLKFNVNNCLANGIRLGVYHFYECDVDPIVQAKHYIKTVGLEVLKFLTHGPIIDYEKLDGKQDEEELKRNVPNMKKFMEYIEKETGRTDLIIYIGEYLLKYLQLDESCTRWKLWVARYGKEPTDLAPWKQYWAWQYAEGKTPSPRWSNEFKGIGKCDANVFKTQEY